MSEKDPKEMTKEELEGLKAGKGGMWHVTINLVCRKCGLPILKHPYLDYIFGCDKCDYTTQLPNPHLICERSGPCFRTGALPDDDW